MRAFAAVLLLAAVAPARIAAQQEDPACWVQGNRADLELRASPYDSTRVRLDGGVVKVCYSRPRKLDRPVMDRLVPYGVPWRLGANEATAIYVPGPATVAGVAVERGWYSLMAVPNEHEWRIIVNATARRWGIPIDQALRVADVGVGSVTSEEGVGVVELFTLGLQRSGPTSADLAMAWDRTRVRIPVVLTRGGDRESHR